MNLKSLTNQTLITEAKSLVCREREVTAQILHYLAEIYSRRLYLDLGYSSLFSFCVKSLGYTESQAQRRIEAMKAIREIPQIETKICAGELSLTSIAQAQSFFRQNETKKEEKLEILKALENKSTRECEKILVNLSPAPILPKEKIKPITPSHTQITLNLPNDVVAKLERLKNLMSHKNLSQSELINELCEMALNKLDPDRKQKRKESRRTKEKKKENKQGEQTQIQRAVSSAPKVNGRVNEGGNAGAQYVIKKRKRIPGHIRRFVWQRDLGQCTYKASDGTLCGSKFKLQLDHVKPAALGGSSIDPENLRLLCQNHNLMAAVHVFGREYMGKFIDHRN